MEVGYIIETQVVDHLGEDVSNDQLNTYELWSTDDMKIRCYMLASMNNELQKQHENMKSAHEILKNLGELYGENSRTTRYEITKELFHARMQEGTDVGAHVQRMIRLIQQLEKLEFRIDRGLYADLVIQSLPDSF
ncbi:uncharacterized protein LOC116214530 [Punica granatum]|uniref:Uncharacterized protein LOC116214530 n=1 Tax=Punica granatum TaxID=22663 RepID=A0A6P8EKD1_PUNGR|nr:uncharacterized protein LOC116214530 [Punica granatum]